MAVSFQMVINVTPFNITPFIIITNHFAGIILLITCNGTGILVIGKIKPDNNIVGNINPIKEIIMAVCWVADSVEIKIPKAKDVIINKILSKANKIKLPSIGILNTKTLNKTMTIALIIDKRI
jgi:hypothetical protein